MMCLSEADETARTSAVNIRSELRYDVRSQSADSSVELSTSLTREPYSIQSPTSRQTGSRSREGGGQRSRIVPPRACVHRPQPRDPDTADGTQVNDVRN